MFNEEIITKTMLSLSGMILSSVSIIQIIHLYKKKNSDGVSVFSLCMVVLGFILTYPYLILNKLYILLLFNIIQMIFTTSVIFLAVYYRRKNKNKLEIINDINSQSVSYIDKSIFIDIV